MASPLFLGGMFNKMFLTIPYYLWIIVGMILLGIMTISMWYFLFWWKLKPYHGIFWSTIKKMGASLVFDENMHFDLITERSAKVIFNETFKQAQEAEEDKTEAPTASIGTVRTDFVFDPDKWTYPNSYQHKLIEDIAEKHNNLYPHDQVRTLLKFSRYMSEGKFDGDEYEAEMRNLKRSYMVPWARIAMMYRDREESQTFGFVMSLAQLIEKVEGGDLNGYGIFILIFFGIIDAVVIGAHYIGR